MSYSSVAIGISLGVLIGAIGGMWLLFNLISIHRALEANKRAIVAQTNVILAGAVFFAGNGWAAAGVIPALLNQTVATSYFVTVTTVVAAIICVPCYKIIVWAVGAVSKKP